MPLTRSFVVFFLFVGICGTRADPVNTTFVSCDRAGEDAIVLSHSNLLILKSEAYPLAFNETRTEMCNVVLEAPGGWFPKTMFWVFPHGLFGELEYAEIVVEDWGIESIMGFATVDTSEGYVFSRASISVASFLEVELSHEPNRWVGFQMHAILIENTSYCAFGNKMFTFEGINQYNTYYLGSSWHSEPRTFTLPAMNCSWTYDAPAGFEVKFVQLWSALPEGETLTLTSGKDSVIFDSNTTSKNVAYYFGNHLEVNYVRTERKELSKVGFEAVVSAFYNATDQNILNCSKQIDITDDDTHSITHVYNLVDDNCTSSLATVSTQPGFELHIEVDSYELETCCDRLFAQVTDENNQIQRFEMVEFSQLTLPWTANTKPVEVLYERDGNIEYSGINLNAFRMKCQCAQMEQVVLKDDGLNNAATIHSFGEPEERSYCNSMSCGWSVTVPTDTADFHYGLDVAIAGRLRKIVGESLTAFNGTTNRTFTDLFAPPKYRTFTQTEFYFNSGLDLFTLCDSIKVEDCGYYYFFRIDLTLVKESTTPPPPTLPPLKNAVTTVSSCDRVGEDALVLSHNYLYILKSEAYPLAYNETRQEMCNFVLEAPGGWNPPTTYWVFPHALFDDVDYTEVVATANEVDIYLGGATADTSAGHVLRHSTVSISSQLEIAMFHRPSTWTGFQMHAILIENVGGCPFDGLLFNFRGVNQFSVYYISSSWHDANDSYVLPARECQWGYDAPAGYIIKFVLLASALEDGESIFITANDTLIEINNKNAPARNTVYYFGNYLRVRYSRVSRRELDTVGFSASVSAYLNRTAYDVLDCTDVITLTDDNTYHVVYKYSIADSNCSSSLARVSIPTGYELHIEVDTIEVETCCDHLFAQITNIDGSVSRHEIAQFTQITATLEETSQPIQIFFEKDGNIEYSGLDLKVFRMNCSCPSMGVIELADDGYNNSKAISSYGEIDSRSYCNRMHCAWNITIPEDNAKTRYSVEIALAGALRDLPVEKLTVSNGTGELSYAVNVVDRIRLAQRSTVLSFNSDQQVFTHCSSDCPDYYFWRADITLVGEPTETTLPIIASTVTSSSNAGQSGTATAGQSRTAPTVRSTEAGASSSIGSTEQLSTAGSTEPSVTTGAGPSRPSFPAAVTLLLLLCLLSCFRV